ncbi:MAG: DUF2203 family protein [Phycisphaerales bacterium]
MSVVRRAGSYSVNLLPRPVVFSVSEARRALPYVARAVRDICDGYQTAQRCRAALAQRPDLARQEWLVYERDSALRQLNRAIDECDAVGAEVTDISTGSIRFEARTRGRAVSLLWRIDEPTTGAWADLID